MAAPHAIDAASQDEPRQRSAHRGAGSPQAVRTRVHPGACPAWPTRQRPAAPPSRRSADPFAPPRGRASSRRTASARHRMRGARLASRSGPRARRAPVLLKQRQNDPGCGAREHDDPCREPDMPVLDRLIVTLLAVAPLRQPLERGAGPADGQHQRSCSGSRTRSRSDAAGNTNPTTTTRTMRSVGCSVRRRVASPRPPTNAAGEASVIVASALSTMRWGARL